MRLVALPLLLLSACVAGEEAPGAVTAAADIAPVRVTGPAERCLQTSLIQNTDVQSGGVIDFRLRNGRTYRSTLPATCPGLGYERRFVYRSTVGQLCRTDTITVLRAGGPGAVPGATCALGEFVPVEPVGPEQDGTLD